MADVAATETPQIGMLATVRNRRGVVTSVEPFGTTHASGLLHLVRIEYTDADGAHEEHLIWEREANASLVSASKLPNPDGSAPLAASDFDALVRAARWTALTPFLDPDESGPLDRLPLAAPFHGAIQVEDFQLVPLLKALRMPRISLLLADDVGLGKTVEAGMILSELLLRRRIRRVLIICPASLRTQWRQEMSDKFALHLDEVDKEQTQALKRQMGMDANPWRTYPKIVTSYHYLKQPDVLEEFRAASRMALDSPHLPWDLLIVDESHNLAPAPFGQDSDLSKALGQLAPLFEHRLFLTATPHNGHTRSFSGLLERLDPVRFTRRSEMTAAEKRQAALVIVRRLKSEINASGTPRFCQREVRAEPLALGKAELRLNAAYQDFRKKVRSIIASPSKTEQVAGRFAVEVLGKRLLSCPYTFSCSWKRYLEGIKDAEQATAKDVSAADRAVTEETSDDRETESRIDHAAQTVGAWLRPFAAAMQPEIEEINASLSQLGLSESGLPKADARFVALLKLVDGLLRENDSWRSDERMVIFTEYKTTLDYLVRRLNDLFPGSAAIAQLFGGMQDHEREAIKAAFNNPDSPVRVLVATDAASEGLNLQESARFLLHFDVPWNPSRLEQRNGRLDRHGQARDVSVFHFVSEDDADLRFLAHVVGKVERAREDLGSVGEVIAAAVQRRLIEGEDAQVVITGLDQGLQAAAKAAAFQADHSATSSAEPGADEMHRLEALKAELDLSPATLRDTLAKSFTVAGGGPNPFSAPDAIGAVRMEGRQPAAWQGLIKDFLALPQLGGAMPRLVFDPQAFIRQVNGRPIFRQLADARLLHLAHPLYQRALASLAMFRFPGVRTNEPWTVRRDKIPAGLDALLLLTVEEMAVNELRESFHHWVTTVAFPIRGGALGKPLPHKPARDWASTAPVSTPDSDLARNLWSEVESSVGEWLELRRTQLSGSLSAMLLKEAARARDEESERFNSRHGELSKLITEQTVESLRTELDNVERAERQRYAFDQDRILAELAKRRTELKEEIDFRTRHYTELRDQLSRERERVLNMLIPKRHAMRGKANVFPVAVEFRLPEARK